MKTTDLLKTATSGLRTFVGRSILTTLGIVIGVAAIVLILSLGESAQQLIIREVQSVGGDAIIVRPGRQPEGPTDVAQTILADSLTTNDVEALSKPGNVPGVRSVHPLVIVPGSVVYQDNVYRPTTLGWDAQAIGDIFDIYPSEGDFFTDGDLERRAKVAVIGARVREKLFDQQPAVGEKIRVGNTAVRVVGVLPARGQVSFFNVDEIVLLPFTTAQQNILGIDHVHEAIVRAADPADVEHIAEDIRLTLRERHRITDPSKDDFFVLTQEDILERISTITQILTIFLASIAGIALVVGGVGIMNIMLVSVTERTQEIGLRKAVGATNRDILLQFLIEALILTIGGGVGGIIVALGLSSIAGLAIRRFAALPWEFFIPLQGIMLGLVMATVTGLLFGLYPAIIASRKSPTEALRYE